jgi:alkanesulfonate monooxygenase SsuD/methylene tetrahydromethanopterin reductase-like flavin-dependent oxidoreductase (luciferase family)
MVLSGSVNVGLRYDMRAPDFAAPVADLYTAALEQSEWADKHGFTFIRLNEHHGSADGYLPSPLIMAAAIATRTTRVRIRLTVLVLPLHDPVRVAEDAAVVDLISRGRLEIVVAGGYRSAEFATFGKRLEDRTRLVAEGVAALRAAWTGEPFEIEGRSAFVRPRPFSSSGIPILLGGSSEGAARRAARMADGFDPASPEFNN